MFCCLCDLFWFLLKVFVTYRICKALVLLWRPFCMWFIYPKLGWTTDLKQYAAQWVAITGCTDGIGKAYMEELAKRGLKKFMLIGRNPKKLEVVEDLLKSKYDCEVRTYVFDFAKDDYDNLPEDLQTYDIGILVNCAGIAVKTIETYTNHPAGLGSEIVKVNAMSMVKMCELVLPGMVKRDKGIIVNFSSILGWRPIPYFSSYPASKSCVSFLSECLHMEYKNTNIKFQCLMPLAVATNMTQKESGEADGILTVSPEKFASNAVDIIGIHNLITGCIIHDLQVAILILFPHFLAVQVMKPIYYFEGKRLAALAAKNE